MGAGRGRRLSAAERRAQVLDAARTLFAKRGYAETTLDAIAAEVGVSRARVIQLFDSKEGVYRAIALEAYKGHPMDKDLAEPMRRKDDMAVFQTYAAHILHHSATREDREILKILMYARLREDDFLRVHFDEKDTLMISRLTDYVAERVEAGVFKNIDPRVIVFAYQGMMANMAVYKNVLGRMDFIETDRLARSCALIFLEGLLN